MQHVGSHYSTGNTTAFHSMHFTPAAENTTTNVSSGPTTTSVLRSWRKKDASEKQPPTTSTPAEPPSGNVTENQGPVARVAPHNHYPKPSPADIYRFPQQHGDYGVQNVSQLPAPVKYSEIIEPMQSIEQIPPLLQKPKEKSYMEMCNVQQNHMKAPYPDYQNYKQHYDGLKNYNHMPSYKQQYHPYLQKESQMPGYVQKEANLPPQYLHNYKMPPTNYPRNYPREGNEFLANLNKIAPDMAQDIINDPHLRDPHLREPQFPMYPPQSMDQNRLYQQQHQRMYQRTSPVQHGVQNYGQRNIPQNFNQYQMNQQRMPPSDPYRMYSPHQRYGQVETQMPTNISPRQYHENMMNFPSRISPNYPSCGQLEYAQHYQPRQVPMRQEFLPIPNKPYIETHPEIPEIVPDESLHHPKKTLKAYLENWREEFTEEVESTEALATDKIQLIKSSVPNRENTLYVLDAMEIPSENIPQYIHLQPIDKLPPNIRAFAYNAEENVRQNAIVISANMKNNEMQKNEIPKDSGTYQLFQNKTEGNTDNLVYQPNVLSAYKSEDILSHEDRPACKLLQSMVKARNANAIEKPIGKQDAIIGDKDKILRSCFQEPQKEMCRSLPQLINEDAEELHKNNEEHLENEYSKIVDSILEENTQSVQVLPISETVENASAKTEEKKEITKANDHLITTNNNSSINFTENLINSLEIVERKSVIAENTIPHIATDNSKQSELQNSYDYFSIPEDNIENSTTICNNDVKSQNQEEKITETANQKLNDEEPPCKDLQILEDPIDLSHHLEEINSMVETNIETSEKDDKRNEENIPDIIERKHVYTDILEYKDAFNLGKDPDIIEEVQAKTVTSNATPEKETYFSDDNGKNEDNPIQNCPVEELENRSEDKLGNQEQILSNLEDKNEKIDAENSLNQKIEDSEEQNVKNNTCPDVIEETDNSNLQNCVKDDEFQQKYEKSSVGEDIIDTVPQEANLLEDEMQVLNSKDVEIQEEKIFQFTNDISKEEIKKIENPSNEDVICEEITQENINNEDTEDKNTNIICDIDEIDDNNSKDENLSTKEDQMKTESDTEDIIDEEIQEKLSDIEQLDDIRNEHYEKLNFEDNASPSTIENSDVEESIENIMNVENYEETELNNEDTDASEASEESDEDDNEDYTFEAKSSIIGDVEDGDIVITAKQEDGVEVPSTNEVSLETIRTEENINESKEENISVSKESKSVPVEESVSQDNHAEEATSHTKIPVGVIEEDEIIRTSKPLVEDLDEKEENNNEIIKEASIKHDDIDDQACEDKKMKEHDGIVDEEKEDSLINALNNEINELNRISYLRAQEAKINQSNIQEGAKTKEDIGSSFVLEIAKELLQINVMENSNGEKVIAITPLTKVKIVTPAEIARECTDKQEEISVQTNNKITENDEFKNEEEEENEITNNATDDLEINEDLLLYENEIEEISETVVTTEETQESDQKAVTVDVIKIEDGTEIEEVSETVVTTEDTQDTESEQETATENVIEVEDKTEDNFEENLQNTDHTDAIIDHIIEENEILIEECNEIETDLKIEDDAIQQITEDHIIPGSDLDLHNEVIIVENKDEVNDEIILDNAQTEIVVDQSEEIFKNDGENKTILQEDTIFNNNSIESHEATKDEKEDKNKEQTNKLSSIQNTNKKVFKSKRTNEKKPVENKKSQLNALRNFRKIKNRNSGNFEISQSKKFVSQSSKKKKNDLSNVEKFKASLDNAERAKIFSSIVVIDKIPLETIKKVTRRIENKFDDKSKKKIKRYSKIKLKDNKLSKEYKNIKTKFKRQREISRDIKRLMRKSNSFKSIHKNDEKNRSKDNSKDTSAKSIGIRDKTKAQNENNLVVIEKVKQTIPDVVSVTKPISLQSDNCSNVLINLDDKPVDCSKSGENSDIGKSSLGKLQCEVKEIRLEDDQNNLKQSFEKLKPKREDQTLIKDQKVIQNERENDPRQCFEKSKSKIGDQNSIKEQKLVQNEETSLKNLKVASATQATSSLAVKDQITKPLPNYPIISQTINPNKHPTIANHTKILPITNIQPIQNQHHFQTPFPKDVHSLVRKHPKELRRTKSDTYFNADFLLNFKKRRLSLEEYNNRKKNLNKLANQKIEAEIKEKNKSSIAIEENKEKEKMVEEVLKSLKSEEIELSETGSSKDVPSQIESINDINMKSEDVLNYKPENPEPVQEKTPNKEITESKLVENVEELLCENIAKNSESIEEKVSIMMSDDPGKPELVENSTKNDDTSVEELIIQEHSEKVIEVQKQEEMLQNEFDNNSNINIEPTKDEDIKSNEENNLEMELSHEDKIQGYPEESSMEANTSKVQINSSSEIPQSLDSFQKNLQTDASKPKEHFDKSSIEEKVNSLEEFLPKISPKDPIRAEISRKLEEFLNENPITYDQKHFEMLLIKRFLNRETLTSEELKRVRQIVHYKRAFQSMKKSAINDIPKRRYSSEFPKSIKIDFNDFNLKKSDPAPSVKKEVPVQRKVCYNRSISAFVEAESRRNELRNRRILAAKAGNESQIERLNKEGSDRKISNELESLKQSGEHSLYVKSSVIVENAPKNKTEYAPNSFNEKSILEIAAFSNPESENIEKITNASSNSSPRSKLIINNNIIEISREECKNIKSEPLKMDAKESVEGNLKNILRECDQSKIINKEKVEESIKDEKPSETLSKHISTETTQNKTEIDSKIKEINTIEDVSSGIISDVKDKDKNQQELQPVPPTVPVDQSKPKDFTWQEDNKPNSLTENASNPLVNMACSSKYIKHTILSIISKDNEATSESSKNRAVDGIKERPPDISSAPKRIKHAIENLISRENTVAKKPSDEMSKITSSFSNSKYTTPEEPKNILCKDQTNNLKCAEAITLKSPVKVIKHTSRSSTSDDKDLGSANLENSKISVSKLDTKYISPNRCAANPQNINEVIINPSTSAIPKTSKQNETVILDRKEKSLPTPAVPIKNTKEFSQHNIVEEKQKKLPNTEQCSSIKSENFSNRVVVYEGNKKRNFEQSPIRKTSDVNKEKLKIKKFERNQQEIANLERSVSNLTIDKEPKKYPNVTKECSDTNLEKPILASVFNKKENEKNLEGAKMKSLIGNENLNRSPRKISDENIKYSEMPSTSPKSITNKEYLASPSGSKQSCSSSKTKCDLKEISCQSYQNKTISKTKAQLKSFQDSIEAKPKKEGDQAPDNANISPVISNLNKLTALLTYYKRGLESGASTASLKKIEEIMDKVSPNLRNLPTVPDINIPNEYAIAKPDVENSKLKLHLRKIQGENKKKKKRFRNLYTENDSEEDGCVEPKVKEPKMDENAIDYSVYQRKSPAGVPKLVIKRRKSDFKSDIQPYVKISRIQSIESMVKKRKRTIFVNQVFVDI